MLIKSSYPKFGIVIHVGTPRKKHQCIQPICSFTCNENKPMPWQFWISGLEYSHHRYVEDTVPHVWLFFPCFTMYTLVLQKYFWVLNHWFNILSVYITTTLCNLKIQSTCRWTLNISVIFFNRQLHVQMVQWVTVM